MFAEDLVFEKARAENTRKESGKFKDNPENFMKILKNSKKLKVAENGKIKRK